MRVIRRLALLGMTGLLAAAMSLPSTATIYYDVRTTDWFAPAAGFVVNTGLFTGMTPGYFAPSETMSRGMFYTVLSRAAGIQADNSVATNLVDVPAGTWYTGAVIWAMTSGLTECASNDLFGAYEPVSRAELCRTLARYDRLTGSLALPAAGTATFPDLGGVDEETSAAIASCQAAGVVQGHNTGLFDPHGTATRAEVAQMLHNFFTLPQLPPLPTSAQQLVPWDTINGWEGTLEGDFPLADADQVSAEMAITLNCRILQENHPRTLAPSGTTLDDDPKHVTNYGTEGTIDCVHVSTVLHNRNNEVDAGVALNGRQEYYGYVLQVDGVLAQDRWHAAAEETGKDIWQCTWWVWGRASQYMELAYGLDLETVCGGTNNFGHAWRYYNGLKPYFLSDWTPSANSIVSWDSSTYGHVAYVEAVDDNGIWVSMADSGHAWRGVTYIPKGDDPDNPYHLYWYPDEQFNGFNHLDFAADGTPIG